jgi:solute carrier family 36 (proton-coupled amino acid transporter)
LFEGSITLLVPLQEAVVTEEDRQRFPTVYRNTILCIIAFYIFFSITCWMSLGDSVRTVLTTSLPAGNAATSVQLAYSIAVIFTFPLQNFPALEITCRSISNALDSTTCCGSTACASFFSQRNVISSVMVGLLAIIAVTTMNSLDKVVSLMGGLLGCPIAFVFPPLIHYKLLGGAGKLTNLRKLFDGVVILLGLVATCIATFTTIMTWD